MATETASILEIKEAEKKASEIIEEAEMAAKQIVIDAKKQADQLREAARSREPKKEEVFLADIHRQTTEQTKKIEAEFSGAAKAVEQKGKKNLDKTAQFIVDSIVKQ